MIRKARSTVDLLWAESDPEDYEELFCNPKGELVALPFIWEQQFFIDAKVPNKNGEVPIGGSY